PKNGGFTLLEVLAVVVIIGILAGLAYSSLMDIIFTNRAKETAQTMRTFVEKSLAEAKRQSETANIKLNNNGQIVATIGTASQSQPLSLGYSINTANPIEECLPNENTNNSADFGTSGVNSAWRPGLSSISGSGYFTACDARDYCGAAVKVETVNTFIACIKRGRNARWEKL
ncbi:MAG: type II secretion system GspH family protein, partial [Fibromonadales bacterium]|nr:type II secretion system GspH family protein [Fibromonadales bacterium]